jgi:cell wall-associated NlpC family hydrolase
MRANAPRADLPTIRRERFQRRALNLTWVVCLALASGCASNARHPAPVDEVPSRARQEHPSIIWEPASGAIDGARAERPSIIWEPSPGADSDAPALAAADSRQVNYRMAMAAKKMLGVPYRWGGTTSAGFDCSGLVYYAYRKVGLSPPRTTWHQYQRVRRVDPSNLRVGDLLFFRLSNRRVSHVAIYLGQNQFVHAPATGSRVSYARLTMPFWRQRFIRAGRLY